MNSIKTIILDCIENSSDFVELMDNLSEAKNIIWPRIKETLRTYGIMAITFGIMAIIVANGISYNDGIVRSIERLANRNIATIVYNPETKQFDAPENEPEASQLEHAIRSFCHLFGGDSRDEHQNKENAANAAVDDVVDTNSDN